MSNHRQLINENFSISHGDELKDRKFYSNTVREYQVGRFLQSKDESKHLVLHVDFVQSKGDFSLNDIGFELKENSGALTSGYLSFELVNTRKVEISGIMQSYKDGVKYFLMYIPGRKYMNNRYSKYQNQLYLFDTKELYEWLISQEYIVAENNRTAYSNAVCFKVPLRYIVEHSFKDLIKKTWTVTEDQLNSFGTPEGVDSYFVEDL